MSDGLTSRRTGGFTLVSGEVLRGPTGCIYPNGSVSDKRRQPRFERCEFRDANLLFPLLAQLHEDGFPLSQDIKAERGHLQPFAPSIMGVRVTRYITAVEENCDRLRCRLLRDRHATTQIRGAIGTGGDGSHREVVDWTEIVVSASGQLDHRGVYERAVAAEEEEREIGARARHAFSVEEPLDNDNLIVYT
jgi:hypothetical protein